MVDSEQVKIVGQGVDKVGSLAKLLQVRDIGNSLK